MVRQVAVCTTKGVYLGVEVREAGVSVDDDGLRSELYSRMSTTSFVMRS